MPTSLGDKLWRHITGRRRAASVAIVAQRFFLLFRDHGVEASQIPRLVPQLGLDDLQSNEKLLSALTPEILDQTARLFGVRTAWLEGVDDDIYEHWHCYKQPKLLLEQLASLSAASEKDRLFFPLRVLTTADHLDYNGSRGQLLAPVLVEKIAELGEEDIYRYYVYRDGFDWGYPPSRIQLKAMVRVVYQAIDPVPLFVISPTEMQKLLEGRVIPRKLLDGCLITEPSLEDYSISQTGTAKEVDELPAVLSYIQEHNLQSFSFRKPEDNQLSAEHSENIVESSKLPEPEMAEIPKKTGKRAQAQAEIWEPVRNAAETLWAEDNQLSIAEVVRRIKRMPVFRASVFTESAIRKRIADLAPVDIRGKPGRKPKKSS